MDTTMPTDCKGLTIVITFLGVVMLGFWVAHVYALYTQDYSITEWQARVGVLASQIASART
jgi:hypothetical protein